MHTRVVRRSARGVFAGIRHHGGARARAKDRWLGVGAIRCASGQNVTAPRNVGGACAWAGSSRVAVAGRGC